MADGIDPSKLDEFAHRLMHMRMEAAAIHLVNSIKVNISVPSRTVTFKQGRGGKFRKVLGPRGSSRSKPGDFPNKDYGTLRQSITWDIRDDGDVVVARVGTPVGYSRHLEFGTSKMAARPFLRRTLKEETETIRQIVERGGRTDISVSE